MSLDWSRLSKKENWTKKVAKKDRMDHFTIFGRSWKVVATVGCWMKIGLTFQVKLWLMKSEDSKLY